MARMYPNRLDPRLERFAEGRLYEAFRDELDNSYTVFHSVDWQSIEADGRPRDGEADFVVAHPQRGILVMEVKGGSIDFNPRTGRWTSTSRGGRVHAIKDPFAQARNSKYILLDQIKIMLGEPERYVNVGHAVAFPDVTVGRTLPGLDKHREIIMDAGDLGNLSGWVGQALSYYRGKASQRASAPGEGAVRALMDLLGKAWELRPALWGDFVQEQQELIRLTEQQYLVLDVLNRQRRAAVSGCAGSGKTMLAVEKASRLARQGFRVLLTCFNKALAADLRANLKKPPSLDIVHFHELCYELVEEAGVPIDKQDNKTYFEQQLPEALMTAVEELDVRYDAIVVDEGQDFHEDWWIPLQMLLRHPDEGILYIFYDDNQRIYARHSAFPIEQPPYPLTVNCRNTQRIHHTVMRFYNADAQPAARGPQGRPVEVIRYGEAERVRTAVHGLLRRLTDKDRVPTDEITVLTPCSARTSALWQGTDTRGRELTADWPPPPGKIHCSTIQAFKGLERAVIVLVEIDRPWLQGWTDLDMLLYVGCSRARNHLIVLLSDDANSEMRDAFSGLGA
jgi:hypothetical protein